MRQWATSLGYTALSVEALCDPEPCLHKTSAQRKQVLSEPPKDSKGSEARERLRVTIFEDLHRFGREAHLKGYEQVYLLFTNTYYKLHCTLHVISLNKHIFKKLLLVY